MAIDLPQGDLANAITHEPDTSYPDVVQIRLVWLVKGQEVVRTHEISAAQFFGRGQFGAPMPGEAMISAIERMRKEGPPTLNKSRKASR